MKLNSDSGICEHHFRKVCGQGFFEQKLSFEGRHLFDSLNKPAAKRSAAVVDPRRWNRTVHLTSEYVHLGNFCAVGYHNPKREKVSGSMGSNPNHLAPQLTDSGLPRHRQVLPAGGVAGAQVLLSHHPLRRPSALAGKAYAPQSLGFDLVHHCHQRI